MLRGLQIKRWKKPSCSCPRAPAWKLQVCLAPFLQMVWGGAKGRQPPALRDEEMHLHTVPDVEIEDQIMHPAEPHWRDGWVGEDWQESKCVLEKCFGCTVYIKILTARLFSHSWILTPFQIHWTTLPGKGSANVTSALTLKALPNCNRRNHLLGNHLYNC